jgi:hypothetical protein
MRFEIRGLLADCDEIVKRNPSHCGALSGCTLICMRLEFHERARGQQRSKTI